VIRVKGSLRSRERKKITIGFRYFETRLQEEVLGGRVSSGVRRRRYGMANLYRVGGPEQWRSR
jgi:hypothetical protein